MLLYFLPFVMTSDERAPVNKTGVFLRRIFVNSQDNQFVQCVSPNNDVLINVMLMM
jgi:hypothetical protein